MDDGLYTGSGHYTASCRMGEAHPGHDMTPWGSFSDEYVGQVAPGELETSAAYLLFYVMK